MLHLRRFSLPSIALVAILALAIPPSRAQETSPGKSYTLKEHVREVLTDITVTDAQGNPITGLPQSAFHIYDNGHPQTIQSFTAHSGSDLAVTTGSTEPGVYSNHYLAHPPAVYNIVLIDLTTMKLNLQMTFRGQLFRIFQNLPPAVPVAIYVRNGPRAMLVQNFTTNHDKLLASVRNLIPGFRPVSAPYDNEQGVFSQMANYLSQYPGRKNLLWFNGGSNLFLMDDAQEILSVNQNAALGGSTSMMVKGQKVPLAPMNSTLPSTHSLDLRNLYNELEAARIAVYPIDVRGLVLSNDLALKDEQATMNEEAEVTGGKAYFSSNSIAQDTLKILNHSPDFYTISYLLKDRHQRNRWHQVRVQVDGPYLLSYRHAYFDGKRKKRYRAKPLHTSKGDKVKPPDFHSEPILFQARIEPDTTSAPHKAPRGTRPYLVSYTLPIAPFPAKKLDDQNFTLTMGVDAVIIDSNGGIRTQKKRLVELSISADAWKHPQNSQFIWHQTLDLPKGINDVYLSVWNPNTGRLGTLQIPLTVPKHSAHH